MRLRQEQIVFVVGLAVLGLLTWSVLSGAEVPRPLRGGKDAAEFAHHRAPNLAVALPDTDATAPLVRPLFAPPRDTRPLPPLELIEPPRPPFAGLLPPGDPGPAPAAFGMLLRRDVPHVYLPDLFADLGAVGGNDEDDTAFFDAPEEPDEPTTISLLQGTSVEVDLFADETPEERTARLEGYKKNYDWILRSAGGLVFGRIENPARFELVTDTDRASEAILFVEIDPITGREAQEATGAQALPFARGSVIEFGYAGTSSNQIELRRREIGTSLTRGSYPEALAFADHCVTQRLEAPQALDVAEEFYSRCAEFDPEDPIPPLGLARCFEAGFRFEDAFDLYNSLLEKFPLRTEVHARLAELEERFLLIEEAGTRFRRAVGVDRNSWEARRGLGRYLVRRGELTEAIEHLEQANRLVPNAADLLRTRVEIRTELAGAYLAAGRLADARRVYEQAVRASESHQRALAGLLVTSLLEPPDSANPAALPTVALEEGVGFELLVAAGLESLLDGYHAGCRDQLVLAVEVDPLRAHVAYDALSFLAEVTGNEEEALSFVELALESDPADAYALFQRGRLLGRRGDHEGAREALLGALELELDFEDALVALGEMAFRLGLFDDAERYLERAVGLDPERAEVHSLRGLNLLRLGATIDARDSFRVALDLSPEDPIAMAGDAWCTYLLGDATEALIQLATLDEKRRTFPDDDSYRVWARAQQARIQEHVRMEEWSDVFNRKRLANGWATTEGDGPVVSMGEGDVQVEGAFQNSGWIRIYREYAASLFVSLEADVWISATDVRAGIFIARERARQGANEVTHEASVSRHKDGSTQVRIKRGGRTPEHTDMEQPFPTGEWVRLRVERRGEGSESSVSLSLNGIPLVEGVRLAGIGQGASPLLVGLFVEGEVGREARVKMDNVAIVYRVD